MPKLTPVDIDPFNVGMSEALPAPQAKLRAKELFGGFGKAFMSGLQDAGRAGATSMMEALENQYVPEGAVGINDAGQWTDKQGNPLNVQRRPNIIPLTKTAEGGYEGAMPAMADVWNTMGGVGSAATLGAGPVLRPALKYKDKIYKAKEGQQHLDALPVELQDTFQKMAMSGEDISHFNFGFINHKGHFLQREDALKYAIDNGLLDPNDAKYGTLVTTMLNDSGAGGKLTSQAVQAIRDNKTKFELDSEAFINKNNLPKLSDDQIISNMLSRIRSIEYDRRLSGKSEDGYPYNHELSTLRKRVKELKLLNDSGGAQKTASQAAAGAREISEVAKKAKNHFGLTDDISEAGYMLPDGSMLDLTGRHYSGGYIKNNKGYWELGPKEKQDYLKGTRRVDHKELDFMNEGGTEGMRKFMNEGKALRLNPGTGFDTTFIPTDKQLIKVISSHNSNYYGEPFNVDLSNPLTGENIASKTFDKPNVQSIKNWIKEETDKYPELFNQSGGGQKLASQAAAQSREMKYPLAKHDDWWGQRQYDQQGGRMETMSPDEFLNKSRPLKIDESSRENIEELKQHILSGKTLDPLNLQQGGKEDGRHRAIAAKELGIKEVPVINFRPAPTFYSAAEKAVENLNQNKASGEQWINTLSNQKGVKGEELEWTGLKEFLKDKPSVTKQDIQDYLKENKVELKEVWKGDLKFDKNNKYAIPEVIRAIKEAGETPGDLELTLANDGNAYRALMKKFPELNEREDWAEIVSKAVFGGDTMPVGTTKYSKWQLPGATNYRELLLTLPVKTSLKAEEALALTKRMSDGEFNSLDDAARKELFAKRDQLLKEAKAEEGQPYKSSHWDEPNPLVHMRMNDRTIDGKKSLHLEEIQSDWHQQGRDRGYKDNKIEELRKQLRLQREELINKYGKEKFEKSSYDDSFSTPELKKYWNDFDIVRVVPDDKVPDAPFKKTWHELALKRAIREAAENGYERLSWTPGEAQAARYNLSKQVDNIKVEGVEEAPGVHFVDIKPKNGKKINLEVENGIIREGEYSGKPLADVVGKEMAEKILAVENSTKDFSGIDLKIGGEGMKGFYDQIIPKSIEKIAKEFGVKVKKGNVLNPKEYEAWKELNRGQSSEVGDKSLTHNEIFYIDIPDNMRQSIVGKGQPLFSGTPTLSPIDYQPEFEEETK